MENKVPVGVEPAKDAKDRVEDQPVEVEPAKDAKDRVEKQPAKDRVGNDSAEDPEESTRLFFLEIIESVKIDDNFCGNIRNVRYPPNFTGNRLRSRSPFR